MKRALTNQELLDRYIHSVKTMLPLDKADDIAAEMSSNLQSLVEDKAMELGRELRPDEMSTILKQHGHPVVVASRYREEPARSLIGPQLFPFYWFTLRAIFGCWVTIRVIVAVFVLQGNATAGAVLQRLGRDILLAGIYIAGGVTLLFTIWEYLEFRFRYSARWKPESLLLSRSPSGRRNRGPGLRWFAGWCGSPFWRWRCTCLRCPGSGRGVFSPSDAVYAMRLPLWLLAVAGISQSWLSYKRFAASEWRAFLRVAVNVVGIALAISVLRAGDLLVAGPEWGPAQARSLATMNQMVAGVLVLVCIFAALLCVHKFRRFIRKGGAAPGAASLV